MGCKKLTKYMYNWMKQYSTTTRLSVVYMIRHCGRNTQLLKCYTWEFGLDFEKLVPTGHVHACVSWKGMPWSKPRGMSTNDKSGSEQDDAWYKHNSQNQSIHQFKSNQIKSNQNQNQIKTHQIKVKGKVKSHQIKSKSDAGESSCVWALKWMCWPFMQLGK